MKRFLRLFPAWRALERENAALSVRCAQLEAARDQQIESEAKLAGQVELLTRQLADAHGAAKQSAGPLRPRTWSEAKKLLGEHDA